MTELTTTSDKPIIPESNVVTPVQLLNIAVNQNADLDKLEKLMDLQQKWEENEAKKAYHQAKSDFKTESINIIKNKKVEFGNTKYSHPTLDHIVDLVAPVLAKYGLTHSWDPKTDTDGSVTVTCTLTHSSGHSESVSLTASPDTSGSKNSIQQIGSTITYLERYTFLGIVGLAAKDQDDDGKGAGHIEGFNEGLAYGMACYRHKEVIEEVKDRIADGDLHAAAEVLCQLSNEDKMVLWRAPTKGGIFTTAERKIIKSDEWGAIVRELKNNPYSGDK